MRTKKRNKAVARHMTNEEKKAVIAVKLAVNGQPLHKRIKYAFKIICGRW